MALSGSVSTNGARGEGDGRYYTLTWSASQSISKNTSTISWSLSTAGGYSGYYYVERTLWVKIDGETVYSKSAEVNRYAGTIASGTKTITHNSDGSRSFTVEIQGSVYYADITCTGSKTFTLDTIARASTFKSLTDGTLGVKQTITADRKSSNFTHTLTWVCGSNSGTLATKENATSWEFTPSLELAAAAPSGTKVSCTFKLTTYNGSTAIGSTSKTVSLTIPASVVPTCSLTLSDTKGYQTKYGAYIQGQSILYAVVNATGKYGSKISSYTTVVNGMTYTSKTFDTNTLKTSGSNTISTTVKDSRGRSASTKSTINVLAYSKPRITTLSVHRCNSDGTENNQGVKAKITYAYSITSLSSKNSNKCTLKYKQSGSTTWTTESITPTSYTMSGSKIIDADEAHSYDISIEVTDDFTTTTMSTSVSTGFCLYHIPASGKGITLGGIAESDGFNVQIDATFMQPIDARERIFMGGHKKTDDEKQIYFESTDNVTHTHSTQIYGGNGSSVTAIGVYDVKNSRSVCSYDDVNNKVYINPKTHFSGGLTEQIPVVAGDCNTLVTSGEYYVANGSNTPNNANGWLTVRALRTGTDYVSQEFTSYQGTRYRRMLDNGTWGSWIREADFVISQGTVRIWTYRKWNSGISECWGTDSGTITKYTTWNGMYGYQSTVKFPGNLFITAPVTNYQVYIGSGFAMPARGSMSDKNTFHWYALSSDESDNVSYHVECYAIGKWK